MAGKKKFKILKAGPKLSPEERTARRARRKRQTLQVLPSLFTMGNAACGFAAIVHVAAIRFDPQLGTMLNPENLAHAGWLLLLAMLFDGLDGRIARMTNTTGDFGGELDSLCDAVSFGVAPGLMVVMTNARVISSALWWKVAWICGLVYACGAIFRLARFNVETQGHDEEAHAYFKGLPSPAAAGAIATLAILQGYLRSASELRGVVNTETLLGIAEVITFVLPIVALATGWLMVSNVRYVHLGNRFLRGRRSVMSLARMFITGLVLFAILPEVMLAVGAVAYAASGPVAALVRFLRGQADPMPDESSDLVAAPEETEAADPDAADEDDEEVEEEVEASA